MDNSIQIPLDLPDVRVLEVKKTEEGVGYDNVRGFPPSIEEWKAAGEALY